MRCRYALNSHLKNTSIDGLKAKTTHVLKSTSTCITHQTIGSWIAQAQLIAFADPKGTSVIKQYINQTDYLTIIYYRRRTIRCIHLLRRHTLGLHCKQSECHFLVNVQFYCEKILVWKCLPYDRCSSVLFDRQQAIKA